MIGSLLKSSWIFSVALLAWPLPLYKMNSGSLSFKSRTSSMVLVAGARRSSQTGEPITILLYLLMSVSKSSSSSFFSVRARWPPFIMRGKRFLGYLTLLLTFRIS